MFDFSAIAELPMNFLHDFSQKLDTRGRNWSCLYRHHDRDRLRFARSLELIFQDPKGGNAHPGYTIDDLWLHIGGISFEDSFQKRCQFIQNLARTMDQGTPWPEIVAKALSRRDPDGTGSGPAS